MCSLAELDKIAYFDISCYDSHRWKLNTASYKILLMGKSHIYTNIFLVSPNCRSCYMEASSQIQNLLCLLLLHLCSSFFHYLTLNQVSEVGTTDRNGGNYLIATIHRGQKFKETMQRYWNWNRKIKLYTCIENDLQMMNQLLFWRHIFLMTNVIQWKNVILRRNLFIIF